MTTKYNGVVQVCPMCDIADCRHIREAQESEPVGYTSQGYIDGVKNSIGDLGNFAGNFFKNKWQNVNIPLYTHPPAQESEPVAVVADASYYDGKVSQYKPNGNLVKEHGLDYHTEDIKKLPIGTKLFAHPPADKDDVTSTSILKLLKELESKTTYKGTDLTLTIFSDGSGRIGDSFDDLRVNNFENLTELKTIIDKAMKG